jgi:tRNA U55 pseudouridine synthase TruB
MLCNIAVQCAAGAASRLTPKFEPLERTYTGTLRLGISTTTYDAR